MDSLVGNGLDTDELHLYNHISGINTDLQFSPIVAESIFEKNSLTMLPSSLFQHMPLLQVLDLSHTNIQSLPSSISKLSLLESFILQDCSLLMEIPHEIGTLKKLKLFDLEGTELMYLPKEIGKLEILECLRVSLSTYADDQIDSYGIEHILPRMTISKLTKLKELSISVSPNADWWEVELLEGIMGDLIFLPDLKTVKLYLPTFKALQQFLSLERYQVPLYSNLWNFRFMIGHCEELPCSIQLDIEEYFLKLEKCVKYMNGEGFTDETVDLIRKAEALYLRRHWTIEKLSAFDIRKLKYCCVMECNEMKTLIDQENLCMYKNNSTGHCEDEVLGSLQYLSVHFMKKLQRISKGSLGGNSLSCLRILALHTCPELTSVFTGCLLHNMQSLTELIVEDCPKVKSLVNLEDGTPWNNGPFLLCLKTVSLIDLPELVSVSGGVSIAPQLDTLHVFNCIKLDYLSVMELPRDIKEVKGEIEWWDALKYGKLTWNSVFVQLTRDGGLMEELAQITNSLQHLLELDIVPSQLGSSLQVDKNLSRHHVDQLYVDHAEPLSSEIQNVSTKEILNSNDGPQPQDSGTGLRMWKPPHPVSRKPYNEDTDYVYKARSNQTASMKKKRSITSKHQVRVTKGIEFEKALGDGYIWRKYGQKDILNAKYPRGYYRCAFRHPHGCLARMQVQRSDEDPSVFEVTYIEQHTCLTVLTNSSSSTAIESACTTLRSVDSSILTESASAITDSYFEHVEGLHVLDSDKEMNSSICIVNDQVKESKRMDVREATDDGYSWIKYDQKEILGAKHPREYYRCHLKFTHGCRATKQVERSGEDPSVFEVIYRGQHTCSTVPTMNYFSTAAESACTTSETIDSTAEIESPFLITDSHFYPVEADILEDLEAVYFLPYVQHSEHI